MDFLNGMIIYVENIKNPENTEMLPVLEESQLQKALEIELVEALRLNPRDALRCVAQMGRTIKNLTGEEGLREVVIGIYPQLRFSWVSAGNKFTLETKEAGTYTIEYKEEPEKVFLFQGGRELKNQQYEQALADIVSSLSEMKSNLVRINRDD